MRDPWSGAFFGAFDLASGPWMRARLRLHVGPLPALPADRPLLFAANHTSWWDGFVLRALQRRLRPRAPLYTLVTSEQLRNHRALRFMGALDVGPNAPGALRDTLHFLAERRVARPDLVVTVFPQGRLETVRRRPLAFRPGVAAVARALAPAAVLPVALVYESFASPGLNGFVSVGAPIDVAAVAGDRHARLDVAALERAVAAEIDQVTAFLDAHGEDAPARWDVDRERQ